MGEVNYIALAVAFAVLGTVIFFPFRRYNKMQKEVGRLFAEARRLDKNIEIIHKNLDRNAKKSGNIRILQQICKNCTHRQTFLYPDSPNDFFYECKLNKDAVSLTDTCDKFSQDDHYVAGSFTK